MRTRLRSSRRADAEAELRDARDLNQTLLDTMPVMFWSTDAMGHAEYFNRWFFEYTGMTPDQTAGGQYWTAMHPDDRAGQDERWAKLRAHAAPADRLVRYRRADGSYRWHQVHARPMRDASGEIVRWFGYSIDVHDQRRAAERQQFLIAAIRALTPALEPSALYESLVAACVPAMADAAAVLVVDDGVVRVAAAVALGERGFAEDPQAREALRTRRPAHTASTVATPILASNEVAAVLVTRYGRSERRYEDPDMQTLQLLGEQLAIMLANVRRFEREHRVAEALQRATLPQSLPSPAAVALHAHYAAAPSEAAIGGDWYDALELHDGRVVLSIGDVTGRGLTAAVTMANIRQIMRGIAHVHADPALMLRTADRALRAEHPDTYVTALACVIDPIGETLTYAGAGHPPAMLRSSDGDVRILYGAGLPLGMRSSSEPDSTTVPLHAGDALVLYTDGLTEIDRRPSDGEAAIVAELRSGEVLRAADPAGALYERLVGERARDDVAILVASFAELGAPHGGPVQRWRADASDAGGVRAMRRALEDELGAASGDVLFRLQSVLAELVGNVARHAPGAFEVIVERRSGAVVLHVLDDGPGFSFVARLPRDPYSERGRGLFIAAELSDDFSVSRRARGGSHARAVLFAAEF